MISLMGPGRVFCLAESRKLLLVLQLLVPCLLVFRSSWDWFGVSFFPAGLHAAEASYVSGRAAIIRAVWSGKMPLANTPAVLNLLDGPVGVDPALHFIWVGFRMTRRYLAYCPAEEPWILGCWI